MLFQAPGDTPEACWSQEINITPDLGGQRLPNEQGECGQKEAASWGVSPGLPACLVCSEPQAFAGRTRIQWRGQSASSWIMAQGVLTAPPSLLLWGESSGRQCGAPSIIQTDEPSRPLLVMGCKEGAAASYRIATCPSPLGPSTEPVPAAVSDSRSCHSRLLLPQISTSETGLVSNWFVSPSHSLKEQVAAELGVRDQKDLCDLILEKQS